MKTNPTENFIQVNYSLLSSPILTSTEKLFIAYIIGWQNNGSVCYQTNKALASVMGLSIDGIRTILKKLNKYDFFSSTQYGNKITNTSYTSTHTIKIDLELLQTFLVAPIEVKPTTKVIPTTKTISTPIKAITTPVEVIPTIEDVVLEEDEFITPQLIIDKYNSFYGLAEMINKMIYLKFGPTKISSIVDEEIIRLIALPFEDFEKEFDEINTPKINI